MTSPAPQGVHHCQGGADPGVGAVAAAGAKFLDAVFFETPLVDALFFDVMAHRASNPAPRRVELG